MCSLSFARSQACTLDAPGQTLPREGGTVNTEFDSRLLTRAGERPSKNGGCRMQVESEAPLPRRQIRVEERHGREAPRVVDQQVDAAEVRHRPPRELLELGRVGHVTADREPAPAKAARPRGRRLDLLLRAAARKSRTADGKRGARALAWSCYGVPQAHRARGRDTLLSGLLDLAPGAPELHPARRHARGRALRRRRSPLALRRRGG